MRLLRKKARSVEGPLVNEANMVPGGSTGARATKIRTIATLLSLVNQCPGGLRPGRGRGHE